jgi:hypothetical protein
MNDLRARKRADLLSITGAAIASAAAGAWLSAAILPLGVPMLVAGLIAHAVGMSARHRLDRQDGPLPGALQMLYVLCWITIAGMASLGVWLWLGATR